MGLGSIPYGADNADPHVGADFIADQNVALDVGAPVIFTPASHCAEVDVSRPTNASPMVLLEDAIKTPWFWLSRMKLF